MSSEADRASLPGEVPGAPALTPGEVALIEAQNALHQFDCMVELIEAAVAPAAKFRFRPSTTVELNRYAVEGLMASPGAYRLGPISISASKHLPPPAEEVPRHMDEMDEADAQWKEGRLDLTKMEQMLTAHLASQLVEIHEAATGQKNL